MCLSLLEEMNEMNILLLPAWQIPGVGGASWGGIFHM